MKGILIALAFLCVESLFGQEAFVIALPPGVEIRNATPQQLADAVSKAVRERPEKAPLIVREVMASFDNPDGKFSDIQKKCAAAVIGAAVAATAGGNVNAIVAAGAGAVPALGAVVAQAANAVPSEKVNLDSNGSPTGMLLGNIRVREIQGSGVKIVDANGKTSNLKPGEFLRQGVRIVTGPEGSAVLIFENGSLIRVNPDTEFSIEKFQRDPFDSTGLDYSTLEGEPSRSVTRTGVTKGEISFDVATLKKSSLYDIVTPVGIAGIRGTGGFVQSTPRNQNQAASFGLFEGSATFTTTSGQTQSINQNQSIGIGGPESNFEVSMNPPGSAASLSQASQGMGQARSRTTGNPFEVAPPLQPAPAGPLSSLSPEQQQALQQAVAEGEGAVAETALQLAMESPAAAADIAAAAADIAPGIAATIATTFSSTFPSQTSAIAASVSATLPVQAASIATAVAVALPSQAAAVAAAVAAVVPAQAALVASSVSAIVPSQAAPVAAAVATSVPAQATAVASAVSAVVPAQAPAIAVSVATAIPTQAAAIALAVASAVPTEAAAISMAVSNALPAQAAAVTASIAAAAPTGNSPIGNLGSALQDNPAPLVPPTSTPTPTPPLTSTPPPTPPPTPVSPID